MRKLLFGGLLLIGVQGAAVAAPVVGSFSLASFGGTFVGGTSTALTATGLDFGTMFSGTGNGYGINGTALVGNATGSFAGLDGAFASVADISLGALANPYNANPFISFGGSSPITLSFTNASYSRSPLGTSVTITGLATYGDGVAADANTGMFSLAVSSQNGSASAANFTFTSNASATAAVPEPATWAMMIGGFGLVGAALRRRNVAVTFA